MSSKLTSNQFHCVIGQVDKLNNKTLLHSDIEEALKLNDDLIKNYYFILHDDAEYKHYHLIIEFKGNKRFAKLTIVKKLATWLLCSCDNISVKFAFDLNSCVRYLTHMDEDESKKKYDPSEVFTNNHERYIELVNSLSCDEIDINVLISLIRNEYTITEIYQTIGLKNATRYRNVIKDIYTEFHIKQQTI